MSKSEDILKKYGVTQVRGSEKTTHSDGESTSQKATGITKADSILAKYGIIQAKSDVSSTGKGSTLPGYNDADADKGWNAFLANQMKKQAEEKDKTWLERLAENAVKNGNYSDADPVSATFIQQVNAYREDTSYREPTDKWSDLQKKEFGFLYNRDPEEAWKYAEGVNNSIASEETEKQKTAIKESATDGFWKGAAHTAGALVTAPLGLGDYLDNLAEYSGRGRITEKESLTPFDYSQTVTGGISEDLNEKYGTLDEGVNELLHQKLGTQNDIHIPVIGGKGWGDVYGLGTSVAQSAIAGNTLGQVGTLVQFFGTAAAAGVDNAKQRGASDGQALAIGALEGAAEGLAEMIGVDNLLKIGSASTMRGLLKNLLKQGAAEGIEEGLTTLMNNFADQMVMQDKSNFNLLVQQLVDNGVPLEDAKKQAWLSMAEDLAFDMVAGFVSGTVHAGPQTAIQTINENIYQPYQAGKYIMGSENGVDALRQLANEVAGVSSEDMKQAISEQTGKVDKKQSAINVGKLYNTVQSANNQVNASANQADIAKSLERKGFTAEIAQATSEALVAKYNGQELTKAQEKLLKSAEGSAAVQDVISNIMNNAKSTMGQRSENIRAFQKNVDIGRIAKASGISADEVRNIAEGNLTATDENGAERRYEVSKDGRTLDGDGNAVTIKGISAIENGRMVLETENGTIDAGDVSYGSEGEALVYEAVSGLNGIIDTDTANRLSKHLLKLGNVSSNVYANAIQQAYTYGYYGYGRAAMTGKNTLSATLTEKQRNVAYGLGEQYRAARVAAEQAVVQAKGVAKNVTTTGKVHFDGDRKSLTERQSTSLAAMETVADALGVQIYVFESEVNEKGKHIGANGWYDPKDNSIHIDLHAGATGEGTMLFTMAHELTHYIRKWSPAKFKILADFLMEEYGKKGVSVDALVHAQMEKAKRNGRTISYDTAYEEVIADSMETMLSDGKVVEKLAKLKQVDKSLWKKIRDFISDMAAKIRKVYEGMSPDSAEGRFVAEMVDSAERLQEMFTEALVEAGENYQASEQVKTQVGQADSDLEAQSKYSLRDVKVPTRTDLENKDPIKVVDISVAQTTGRFADRRKEILNRAKDIISKPYLNKDTKTLIFLTPSSYTHAFNNLGELQLNAAEHLQELVENAVLTHAEPPTHGSEYTDRVYTFFAAAKADRIMPVKLKVKEYNYVGQLLPKNIREYFENNPREYAMAYDTVVLELEEIEKSPSGSARDNTKHDVDPGPEELLTIKVAELLNLVKGDAEKYIPRFSERDSNAPDIRFADRDSEVKTNATYAEILEEQQKLYQREIELMARKREAESNPELLQTMDNYSDLFTEMRALLSQKRQGTATQAELDRIAEIKELREKGMGRIIELQESLGLNAMVREAEEIRVTKEALRVASDEAWAREGAEKESRAIEKAGISAPEYFRKKALKAFKTTSNFNEAGYLLPDGKLLNFSGGERNHRFRDHREIGEIYEATQGAAALNRFLSDGNIRIMAESPGIDLTAGVEPTKEQYAAIKRFVTSHGTKERKFFVDFSDAEGHRAGNYAYDGRVNADRVINDIKYYYATGEIRAQSSVAQFLDSDRDAESVSNRSLLANALETAAQNQIEEQAMAEYKSLIPLLDQEARKLQRLKEQLKELSFAKGPRDKKQIQKLRDEATKTANRIDIYDKQLLELEASKPLRDVLDREKKKAYQRARKRGEQVMKNYQNRAKESAVRSKIKSFKERLERSLLTPSDKRYVPIDLIKAMVEVCDLIDTDTDLYNADGSINKAQEKRDLTKEKLQNLKDEYEKLKTHSDPIYAGEFDEMVYTYLTELRDNFSGKNLKEMDLDELKEMYEILRGIEKTLQNARKLIGWGDAENVYEAGDAIVAEQTEITNSRKGGKRNAAQKARDNSLNLSLSPVRNVERMSGYHDDSYLLKLFKKFEQGIRKKNKFVMEAYKGFEGLTSGKEYDDAIYKEVGGKKYTDVNGRKFGISKMQMMQAILSHERETANGMHHIENSGFSFADLDMLQKGKLRDAISEEYSHRVPAAVNLVAEFNEALRNDKWCQAYMAAARKFFNGTAKDAINETSIALKHRIVAKDKSYIPFEVDKNFVVREISAENDIQQTINSYGMLKDTKKGASQPLIITGLNNILDRHIDQVGNVYGLAIEVRNFNKVWNVKSQDAVGNDSTVKAAIQRNWGIEGVKHIEQAVQDIQGPRRSEQSALYKKVKSGYIGATFLLNLSVVTKQIGSLYSATSMLKWRGPVRMAGNLLYTMAMHKKISAEVDKYTATAWMRRQGLSDAELHTFMTEGRRTPVGRLAGKLPAVFNPGKWITAMDSAVALSLWKYAKIDTQNRTGLEGEALLKATAEFYDEVVENTQSMTDVLHRPEIQKRSDILSESLGMFKTDLYQMAGQLQVTAGRFTANRTKENGMALGRTVYAIAMSAVWAQLMTTVFALLRYKVSYYRDEEDEDLTAESWLKRQGFGLAGDLMGYIFPIFGSELVGTFENIMYGESEDIVDSIALTAINDLYDIMVNVAASIKDGEMPTPAEIKKLTIKALQVFGIPANNILRTLEAIQLHAKDIANGEFLSFEAGVERAPRHHIHRIMEAMDAGKTSVAIGLYEEALEETAMDKSDDGSYGEKELKEAKSTLKTALGTKYKDGEISRDLTLSILMKCFDMDKQEAQQKIGEWDFKVEYDYAWTDRRDAYLDGVISARELKKALMDVGGKTAEEADEYIDEIDFEADYPELVDQISYTQYKRWQADGKPNGVSVELFTDVAEFRDDGTSGETKSQEEVAAYINSLPISTTQKDALWCCFWKESTLKKAPWH